MSGYRDVVSREKAKGTRRADVQVTCAPRVRVLDGHFHARTAHADASFRAIKGTSLHAEVDTAVLLADEVVVSSRPQVILD